MIAPCGFHFCKLGREGFHLELFWATPRPPAEGKGERGQIVGVPKMPTWQNLFSPLLKISPVLLKFGMIALKTLIQRTVDQIFDIFSLRRDKGFQTELNPQIKMKCRPGKTCSLPPCSKLARFCSNLA